MSQHRLSRHRPRRPRWSRCLAATLWLSGSVALATALSSCEQPISHARPTRVDLVALVRQNPRLGLERALAAVRLAPGDDHAHAAIHLAHELTDRHSEAPAVYEQLLSTTPDHARLTLEHGRALFRARRYDRAMAVFDRLIARKQETREASRLRGLALLESGDAAGAAEELSGLDEIDRGTLKYLGIALTLAGRADEAVDVFRNRFGKSTDAEASLYYALALCGTEELDKAEILLTGLARRADAPDRARRELALLYLDNPTHEGFDDPERAVECAEDAQHHGVSCPDILARGYLALGDVEMARVTIELALEDADLPADVRAACRSIQKSLPSEP